MRWLQFYPVFGSPVGLTATARGADNLNTRGARICAVTPENIVLFQTFR